MKHQIIALVALVLLIAFTVALSNNGFFHNRPDYYPQYCVSDETIVWASPDNAGGPIAVIRAGTQVFPTLTQNARDILIEYNSNGFWIRGYVVRAKIVECNR
jgi:hypothetical protein